MSNANVGDGGAISSSSSSTDNALVRWDGTDGESIQDSGVLLSDSDAMTGIASIAVDIGATIDEFSTDTTLSGSSNTALPTEKAVKVYVDAQVLASKFADEIRFSPSALVGVETNFATLEQLSGTTVKRMIRAYSDSTEQYANSSFIVPENIDPSGTITIKAVVMAKTAVISKNVAITFGHLAIAAGEDYDGSYKDIDSGDVSINGTQDRTTVITMTGSVATADWEAFDDVVLRISRPQASSANLADDMYLLDLTVYVPVV